MTKLNITSNIIITGGPSLGFNSSFDVEAYDMLDIVVHGGGADIQVDLQPGSAVQLLAIGTDWQGDAAAPKGKLTFRASTSGGAPVFSLDDPILFAGGALAAFGANQPKSLFFSNATTGADAKDAKVQILLARDATP